MRPQSALSNFGHPRMRLTDVLEHLSRGALKWLGGRSTWHTRNRFVELLKRKLGGNLIDVYNCLRGGYREGRAGLSCGQTGLAEIGWEVTGQVGTQEIIAIRCKKKYFTLRVVKYWNRSLKVAVVFLSLKIFKTTAQGPEQSHLTGPDLSRSWIRWPPEVPCSLGYTVIPWTEIFTVCTDLSLPFGFPDDHIKWNLFRLLNWVTVCNRSLCDSNQPFKAIYAIKEIF